MKHFFSIILCALILIGCTPTNDNIMELQTFTTSRDFVSKIDDRRINKVKQYTGSINEDLPLNNNDLDFDDYFKGGVLQRRTVNMINGISNSGNKVYLKLLNKIYEGDVIDHKFEIYLPPLEAGGGYKMTIYNGNSKAETTIFIGDVYICSGQSNMEWTNNQCRGSENTRNAIETANSEFIRLLKVPLKGSDEPLEKHIGEIKWEKSYPFSVGNFSCAGYQFGKYLFEKTLVPIGLVSVAVGGCTIEFFMSEPSIDKLTREGVVIKDVYSPHWQNNSLNVFGASHGYNALIHPLLRHSFRGILWNQGSSNADNIYSYPKLLEEMISQYRLDFDNPDLLFVLYELNRWQDDYSIRGQVSLAVNEAAKKDEKCCVVSSHDLGEYLDIHPQDKTELSIRAAEEAAFSFYNIPREVENLELAKVEKIADNEMKLHFIGLEDGFKFTNNLSSLEISSDGLSFEQVSQYVIGKDYITISSEEEIRAIRYGLVTSGLTDSTKMNTKNHVGIYNSKDRPLRMFNISLDPLFPKK